MTKASAFTDSQAEVGLSLFIKAWANARGLEILAVWQRLDASGHNGGATAAAEKLGGDPDLARRILESVANSDSAEEARWARNAIEQATKVQAHVLDPVSLGIIGATLIGLVLAARVKKVGDVEFFKGVPPELAKIIKGAVGAVKAIGD